MKRDRRSFLKGSISAPLILTVGPAAARAKSSNLMCLARDAEWATSGGKRPLEMVAVDVDDWLRVQVDLVGLGTWEGHRLKAIPGKYFLGVDRTTYWRLRESGHRTSAAEPTEFNTGNCSERKLGERRFALVYVDPTGRRTGYAFEPKGGTPVTGSCWASVAVFRA